jgi:hypothetical protein
LAAVIAKRVGRNLPAGIAIDAGVIDEEFAGDVLRKPPPDLSRDIPCAFPL